jgi:hypothetical protein
MRVAHGDRNLQVHCIRVVARVGSRDNEQVQDHDCQQQCDPDTLDPAIRGRRRAARQPHARQRVHRVAQANASGRSRNAVVVRCVVILNAAVAQTSPIHTAMPMSMRKDQETVALASAPRG